MSIQRPFESISGSNDPETERKFREMCVRYETQCSTSNQSLSLDHQEYLNHYHKITSLYHSEGYENMTRLIIYDTENESEEDQILDTPQPLDYETCITQLPNGELFFYGDEGIALIVDREYKVRRLPSGIPCKWSSAIYFKNNVYCFGGSISRKNFLAASRKFDLIENRWINLAQMPREDYKSQSVIFNGNILISGLFQSRILLYSIDIDSFTIIPYDFVEEERKILICAERLYLIECFIDGLIYESEDEYNWQQISKSIINSDTNQTYCLYNKGGIYISTDLGPRYYKFDLSKRDMIEFEP